MNEELKEIWIDPITYTGRPADTSGRLAKEVAVYDMLDGLGISYIRLDHDVTPSIEACHDIDKRLGTTICKNLFLCNQQKTKFYLLMMPGTKRFVTRDFCRQIGSSRLSFAGPEFMEKYLMLEPGSVSVMGLMNDRENQVQLYLDREVAEGEYLGCHPCINTSSIRLKTKDVLEKVLPHIGHTYGVVDLAK